MRRKDKKKKNWPTGLYEQNGYFKFERTDGSYKGLGRNKQKALRVARWYNATNRPSDLEDIVESAAGSRQNIKKLSLKGFIDIFVGEILPDMGWGESHTKNQLILLRKIKSTRMANKAFMQVDIKDISDFLSEFTPRMKNRYRSLLVLLYAHAMDKGIVESNIAKRKLKVKEGKKKRRRMSLDDYKAIHALAPSWLQDAMDIALQTTHGRYEVANMKFDDIENGYLYITRKKVAEYEHSNIAIPLEGQLKAIVGRCKGELDSPFLVSKPLKMKQKKFLEAREHWTQVSCDQITKEFRRIVKSMTRFNNLKADETPPTFHEIRSLSIYLLENQGNDVQKRAGHSTRKMTEHYKKGHDVAYIEVDHVEVDIDAMEQEMASKGTKKHK